MWKRFWERYNLMNRLKRWITNLMPTFYAYSIRVLRGVLILLGFYYILAPLFVDWDSKVVNKITIGCFGITLASYALTFPGSNTNSMETFHLEKFRKLNDSEKEKVDQIIDTYLKSKEIDK